MGSIGADSFFPFLGGQTPDPSVEKARSTVRGTDLENDEDQDEWEG